MTIDQTKENSSLIKYLQKFAVIAVVIIAFGVMGTGKAQTSDLIGMLTSQLGVSEQQATGGAGSLFNFAQKQMGADDFSAVSSALPETSDLMGAAPAADSGLLSTGSSLLGSSSGGLGDMAGVASSFSDLGMSPEMVEQFVPVILEYAESAGGEQAMQLLQGALTAL